MTFNDHRRWIAPRRSPVRVRLAPSARNWKRSAYLGAVRVRVAGLVVLFVGFAAERRFGPIARFVSGSRFTAHRARRALDR